MLITPDNWLTQFDCWSEDNGRLLQLLKFGGCEFWFTWIETLGCVTIEPFNVPFSMIWLLTDVGSVDVVIVDKAAATSSVAEMASLLSLVKLQLAKLIDDVSMAWAVAAVTFNRIASTTQHSAILLAVNCCVFMSRAVCMIFFLLRLFDFLRNHYNYVFVWLPRILSLFQLEI